MTAPDRIFVTGIGKDPASHWWHSGAVAGATEYIRADLATPAAMTPEVRALVEAAKVLLMQHDFENPMRQADYHGDICQCRRCRMDILRAALRGIGGEG